MSLPRFFLEHQLLGEQVEAVFPLRLSLDDAKHAKVLRLGAGEHIAVVDASHDYFECEIVSFDDVIPLVKITQHETEHEEGPQVMLVQGLAKGDKMDVVVRHATELGVCAFLPFATERSIVKLDEAKAKKRVARWQAIAKSAAMQSGQPSIAEVLPIAPLDTVCDIVKNATAVLICWEEAPQTCSLAQALSRGLTQCVSGSDDARVALVVGPEGGLSEREVQALLNCNPRASLVSLGPSILRTETAGIVAPALTLYELGRLGNREAAARAK